MSSDVWVGAVIHEAAPGTAADPWPDLNLLLGRTTREFQNSARSELGVSGPITAWQGRKLAERGQ